MLGDRSGARHRLAREPLRYTDWADDVEQTVGRSRDRGYDVRHFALLAGRDTVLRRLRERGFGHAAQLVLGERGLLRRVSFAVSNLDRCLEQLRVPMFAEQLWTDELTIPEVADRIAASSGLRLSPNTDTALRGGLRRAWTGLKHIRFV